MLISDFFTYYHSQPIIDKKIPQFILTEDSVLMFLKNKLCLTELFI